ncbi:SPOR domain-containing protein [Falsiroseomonas tokyonensis]|uniref:SPOR domain-containing protein n=1 Tax=Falsiroseomonas tokyonensis TaxID=430521 RepID=A0ABV7C086_9PROT|nr:SPOR domain-containing protein [Falsiroseomonas tokyonensis]MBU8540089.1 SPOR domain-containing protein [Falsiroseomonas tokyonensis]
MSDMMVPSYRVQRDTPAVPWRMLAVAGGMVAVVAVGAGGYWAFQSSGGGGVPVVEADPRPFKVRPDDPGGLRVPNQNALVLERPANRQANAQAVRPGGMVPEPEAPNIDLLRAAVAPPPVVAPVQPPPAQPVASRSAPRGAAAEAPVAEPAVARSAAPEPAQTVAAPAVPRPVPNGRVMVQLAAVGSEEGARSEFERLSRRAPELFEGRSPVVQRLERDGQPPLFRLRTAGFADQDSARQFCEALRARSFACIPVR